MGDDNATTGTGRLFVLAGPSGVGKDVVLAGIRQTDGSLHFPRVGITLLVRSPTTQRS